MLLKTGQPQVTEASPLISYIKTNWKLKPKANTIGELVNTIELGEGWEGRTLKSLWNGGGVTGGGCDIGLICMSTTKS